MKYLIALPVRKHPRQGKQERKKRKKGPLLVLGYDGLAGAVPQEANNYSRLVWSGLAKGRSWDGGEKKGGPHKSDH